MSRRRPPSVKRRTHDAFPFGLISTCNPPPTPRRAGWEGLPTAATLAARAVAVIGAVMVFPRYHRSAPGKAGQRLGRDQRGEGPVSNSERLCGYRGLAGDKRRVHARLVE